jgi:hypothetical protein
MNLRERILGVGIRRRFQARVDQPNRVQHAARSSSKLTLEMLPLSGPRPA